MRNVPFGPIKEHTCPSGTLAARPAADLPKEHLPACKPDTQQQGLHPPRADHSPAERQPQGAHLAKSSQHRLLSQTCQVLLGPCSGRSLKLVGFPVGKIN